MADTRDALEGSFPAWVRNHPLTRRRFLQVAGAAGAAVAVGANLGSEPVQAGTADESPNPSASPEGSSPPIAVRGPMSIGDLAFQLQYDREQIFRYVADQVRYEPYTGQLRGAVGTHMARAGNSVDKAALLAALLDASLIPYRLMNGPIDDTIAAGMLSGATVDSATVVDEQSRALTGTVSVDPAQVTDTSLLQGLRPRLSELVANVDTLVNRQLTDGANVIVDSLRSIGLELPLTTTDVPESERSSHVWVQAANGPTWLDLDPIVPGTASGQAVASTMTPIVALPSEWRHSVTFNVIEEHISSGVLAQTTILTQERFADELVGVPVSFTCEKPEGIKSLGVSINNTLNGTVQYVVMLGIGDDWFTGDTNVTFGSGGGIFSTGTTVGEGETTGIWLEVVIASPGAQPVSVRRTFFDRVGDAARASGTFDINSLAAATLVDLGNDHPAEFVAARSYLFLGVAGGLTSVDAFPIAPQTEAPYGFDRFGHVYDMVRDAINTAYGTPAGVRVFPDAPNVASVRLSLVPEAPDSPPRFAADIWHRSFGTLPVGGATITLPPAVVSGVLSHAAERVASGEALPPDLVAAQNVSVGRLFELATAAGIAPRTIQGPGVSADLGLPPDVAPRLAAALSAGKVAIGPSQAVSINGQQRFGWWIVDPTTGATSDLLDDGTGASLVEYAERLWEFWKTAPLWFRMSICIVVAASVAADVVIIQESGVGTAAKAIAAAAGGGAGMAMAFACGRTP